MLIETKKTRIPYSQEEKYAFFVEGKIKNPTTCKNKKKFQKAKERRKNKVTY